MRALSLAFRFPEVHETARTRIRFLRTLRVPDNGEDHMLPAGLGAFPTRHVMVDAQFSTSETQPVVLENLELQIPPEISETITIHCPSAPPSSFDPIHWFSGFFAFHGGFPECGFPSEINQAGTALLIEDWQGGSGEVLAQKEYDRSCSPDEPTFTELTTLELVDPTD